MPKEVSQKNSFFYKVRFSFSLGNLHFLFLFKKEKERAERQRRGANRIIVFFGKGGGVGS